MSSQMLYRNVPALAGSPGGVGDCRDCGTSDVVSLERTRFFPRQLVGADDLTQDQVYFREKLRRHNRLLHGWGIVCGAGVTSSGCTATVAPGYVLGPYGDEIVIDKETSIDVCSQDSVSGLDCAGSDVWCGQPPQIAEGVTAYLAVRYVERVTRPVRVPGCGCGCDDGECEYSRTRDGFELKVLVDLPSSYSGRESQSTSWQAGVRCVPGGNWRSECPPCPADPWVILCDLTLSGGEVAVDCPPHRRYVVSFANYGFVCDAKATEVTPR